MMKVSNIEAVVQNTQTFLQLLSRATNRNSAIFREHNDKIASCKRKLTPLPAAPRNC